MDTVDVWLQKAMSIGTDLGIKILGAIFLWVVGRKLIGFARRLVGRALDRQKVDPTLVRYLDSSLGVLLDIVLIMATLSIFGVETTTFAALMAAAGVAIGMAWSGLLSNFAAGVFMIVLRPFKVGDFVQVGGVLGTVREISLFVTAVDTMDNVRTFVGNSRVLGDTIQNFTTNPHRRVELTAQLAHSVNVDDALRRLRAAVAAIPNVKQDPAPEVNVLTFNVHGPVISVRPYTHNDHYWDVFFATNDAIRNVGGEAGYPVPEQHVRLVQQARS